MNQLALFTEKPHAINRWQPKKLKSSSDNQNLKLRPYQKKVIAEVYGLIKQGYKQPLIYAPTGAGKTYIASHITKDALKRDRRVLFLVHRDALVAQTVNSLIGYGIEENLIGYIKAGHPHAGDEHQVIVASIQSLARREFPPNIGLIIVDEAHTTAFFSTYEKVEESYLHDGRTGAIAIGLSASPWRSKSGEAMKEHFDSIAIAATISHLIKDGYLAQPRYFGFGGLIDISQFETGYDGDFKISQVNAATMAEGFNERIVEEFQGLCPERTAITFCSSVEQSRHLAQLFNDAGITAEHLEAATPTDERQGMYERLKSGETRVLCSVGTLTEGFDVKSISAVILARPTKSVALYVQMCGRGLRPFPGKEDCYILDFGYNCKRLGFLSEQPEPTLEPLKPKRESELPTKECPSCHSIIPAMLQVCPECGYLFPPSEKPVSENLFEEKFGELFDKETRAKVKYFRAEVKRRFTKGQPRDRAWELYVKKFNEHPLNEWLEGAVFWGNNTQFNQERFVEYLKETSPVQPPKQEWINFHLQIEFGDKLIRNISPQYGMEWFEVLQVNPKSDFPTIKESYKKLSLKYHPDCGGSTEEMQIINWAFDKARALHPQV
jgi:superfamily II DNA or RNA helicase